MRSSTLNGKQPTGRPRLRGEYQVIEDVKLVEPDIEWLVLATNTEKCQDAGLTVRS